MQTCDRQAGYAQADIVVSFDSGLDAFDGHSLGGSAGHGAALRGG